MLIKLILKVIYFLYIMKAVVVFTYLYIHIDIHVMLYLELSS